MYLKTELSRLLLISVLSIQVPATARGPWKKIDKFLEYGHLAHSNAGIAIIDLSDGKLIYNHNANRLFIPASNEKLLTAYAALKKLSPRFTFSTTFSTDSLIDSLRIHHLIIKSNGDHSMTMAEINLQALTMAQKFRTIEGDVIVDNSHFDTLLLGRGWMWDDRNSLIAPFSINNNRISFTISPGICEGDLPEVTISPSTTFIKTIVNARTGTEDKLSIERIALEQSDQFIFSGTFPLNVHTRTISYPISRPGLFAGTLLKELLQSYGITVTGKARTGHIEDTTINLTTFESPSLSSVLSHMLKESDNLASECILKVLGLVEKGAPGDADAGVAAIKQVLTSIGIDEKKYRIVDGSGLSTYNLITPEIIVSILREAHNDFTIYPEFINALAIGGIDGTLKDRFTGTEMVSMIRGKTGSMSGVSTLSGYLKTKHGKLLAFSILVNGFIGSSQPIRNAQDEIVKMLFEEF